MLTKKELFLKLIPEFIIDYKNYYHHFFKTYNKKHLIKKNVELKNKYIDESVYLIGNGPCLNDYDLKLLQGKYLFVCNDFYLHDDFSCLKVGYYFNMDPTTHWIKNIVASVNKEKLDEINFIFPITHIKLFGDKLKYFKNKYFISAGGTAFYNYGHYLNLHKQTLQVSNILQMYLVASWYFGFKEVNMIGFDFSFLSYKNKNQIPHFYGDNTLAFVLCTR